MRIEGSALNQSGITAGEKQLSMGKAVESQINSMDSGMNKKGQQSISSWDIMDKARIEPYSVSVSEKAIIDAIERANQAIQGVNTTFEYSIHEGTHQIMVKVLNKETNETIREIPSEKILDMVAKMWEMAGIFVDEKR